MLRGKAALITGSTRGIGKEISLTLASHGARVVIQGRDEKLLSHLCREICDAGGDALWLAGDVADPETASRAVALAGKVDILVNNAGMNTRSSTLDMSLEDWSRVMDVNLNGTLHFCRAVLPHMIAAQSGVIVNVSSSTAKTPHRNAAPAYGASKAAVNYLTQHLAQEMAPHGIRVNAVCPGPVESDMTGQWSAEYRAATLERIPLGRLGTPRNIADIVLFLASDLSAFITGETINANGGTYMN